MRWIDNFTHFSLPFPLLLVGVVVVVVVVANEEGDTASDRGGEGESGGAPHGRTAPTSLSPAAEQRHPPPSPSSSSSLYPPFPPFIPLLLLCHRHRWSNCCACVCRCHEGFQRHWPHLCFMPRHCGPQPCPHRLQNLRGYFYKHIRIEIFWKDIFVRTKISFNKPTDKK